MENGASLNSLGREMELASHYGGMKLYLHLASRGRQGGMFKPFPMHHLKGSITILSATPYHHQFLPNLRSSREIIQYSEKYLHF